MVRLPEKVIICPKFAWPKTAIGALGSSVLVKLNASARNCNVILSLTLNSRWMLKSMYHVPGANNVFRPRLPHVLAGCATNAAGLNHSLTDWFATRGEDTTFGRLVPVALLVCVPVCVTENGKPDWKKPNAFTFQLRSGTAYQPLMCLPNGISYVHVTATRLRMSLLEFPLIVAGTAKARYRISLLSSACAQV